MSPNYRLVHLIETRSDALASRLLDQVQSSPRAGAYRNVPPQELKQQVYEIYRHLGEWITVKTATEVEQRYTEIGVRRAQQGVPLSHLIWAITLTKDNLWEFVLGDAASDRPGEIGGKQELLHRLQQFFDLATHSAALGYEWSTEILQKPEHEIPKAGRQDYERVLEKWASDREHRVN